MKFSIDADGTTQVNQSELKLKNVITKFSNEIKPHKGEKGYKDHIGCLSYLMEPLGEECLITQVDYAKARKVKDMLQKTPSNRNKLPLTRDLTLDEQIEVQKVHGLNVLSTASVNKNVGYISALFAWAKRNKYLSENPFEGMKVQLKKKASRREKFDKDEISKILKAIEVLGAGTPKDKTRYWGVFDCGRLSYAIMLE